MVRTYILSIIFWYPENWDIQQTFGPGGAGYCRFYCIMISEYIPCPEILFTPNLTLYVLLTQHNYSYVNLHGACNMGRDQITEKCLYWMPKSKANRSMHLIRQNTTEGQCLPNDDDNDDIPSEHTQLSETFVSDRIISMQFPPPCMHNRLCSPRWNIILCTSRMECYSQPQTDTLLSAMNCGSKYDILYFWLTASNAYCKYSQL
jgi:hypothetical protein